jgi:hypothetical protein
MRAIIECIRTDRETIAARLCTSAKVQTDFDEQRRNILMKWEAMSAERKTRSDSKEASMNAERKARRDRAA